jgi:catechol 2,3-dioxygenase-like lactoylglutathione lyase family enzyme
METNQVQRGRLIDHVHLVVSDLERSKRFYEKVLGSLGVPIHSGPDFFWADELFVSSRESKAAAGELTGRVHLAFQAESQEAVRRAYEIALTAGGKDHGAPGPRPYHPGYFAGFVLDPDGNNIEVVFHGPGRRSAASVVIDF